MAIDCGTVTFTRGEMRRTIYQALREVEGWGVIRSAYIAWREAKPTTCHPICTVVVED